MSHRTVPNEAGDHRAASEPPLGRGRFVCNLPTSGPHKYNGLYGPGFIERMTPGDTLPPAHCIIDLFSSLGFPDLETGSCRWGSSNCGFFFLLVGFCQLWDFFSSSRFSGFGNSGSCKRVFFPPLGSPDLETGSCRVGSANVSFVFLPRLSGFGNRLSKPKPRCSSEDQFLYAYCINRN